MLWWTHGAEVLKKTLGVDWLPRASTTLTRFWGKFGSRGLAEKVGEAARGLGRKISGWEGITEDNLNLDSSVITRYGKQAGAKRGYNLRKPGRPSPQPLLAFLGSGYIVNLWNRSGDTFSGASAREFFCQTLVALGDDFRVRYVLGDTGFYQLEFIKHLEAQGYKYIIAAPMLQILQNEISRVKQWKPVAAGIEVGEFYFEHLDPKWTKPRRYIVVRQEINRRPQAAGKQPSLFKELAEWQDYRFNLMLTNDEEKGAEELWREYRPRANDENRVKELKQGYGFEGFSLGNFGATAVVMVITAVVFHNLVHYLNRNVLHPHGVRPQLQTIRARYLSLPAQLGSCGGQLILRLGVSNRKLRARIRYLLARMGLIPYRLNCDAVDLNQQELLEKITKKVASGLPVGQT